MIDLNQYTSVPYEFIYENLSEEEGIRTVAYLDTRGITTCGIGHSCQATPTKPLIGRDIKVGLSITYAEIEILFNHDIQKVLQSLQSLSFFKSLSESQQYVLISMTFNLGFEGLLKFKQFLSALENHDIQKAKEELADSTWAKQVPNRLKKLQGMIIC